MDEGKAALQHARDCGSDVPERLCSPIFGDQLLAESGNVVYGRVFFGDTELPRSLWAKWQ